VLAAIAPAPRGCPVTVDINAATTAVTMQVMDQLNRGVHRAPEFSYARYQDDVAYSQTHLTQSQAQGVVSGILSSVLGLVTGVLNLLLGSPYQLTCWVPPAPPAAAPVVITGNTGAYVAPAVGVPGSAGGADGPAASATFRNAKGLFYDLTGTRMAVGDTYNHKIRLVDFASSPATVTTLAGTGAASSVDGAGASATFNVPKGVCISGNTIFVAEEGGNRVRAVDIASHVVTTVAGNGTAALADGVGSAARFSAPRGVAVDATGALYVADCGNNVLRKLTSSAGGWTATTVAGASAAGNANGSGAAARFRSPSVLIYDRPHNALLMSDMGNHRIVKIDLNQAPSSAGYVSTFAGTGAAYGSGGPVDGPLLSAQFSGPYGLTIDPSGVVYCTEWTGGVLRRIDPAANQVTTLRSGGFAVSGPVQAFGNPAGVTTDPQGNVYFEEFQRHVIHYAGAAAPGVAPAPNVLGGATTPAAPACP
jgi:sugar lactone lactonase YvrE